MRIESVATRRGSMSSFFSRRASHLALRFLCLAVGIFGSASVLASSGDSSFVDTVADVMAVIVLLLVPAIAIVVFWVVHVLPEKIAHKRHHPQTAAITTLCLLSLVFGGLLWPLAWLWAYTKPVGYRAAYGTDKSEDYYAEMAEKHRSGSLVEQDLIHLREDLAAIEAKGPLSPMLRKLKSDLDAVRPADIQTAAPTTAERGVA
jgi:CBS domain containing-hemolysin-like protein